MSLNESTPGTGSEPLLEQHLLLLRISIRAYHVLEANEHVIAGVLGGPGKFPNSEVVEHVGAGGQVVQLGGDLERSIED
jgi:hypothetical protein